MKRENLKDTFESFAPTEEQKERIYKSIVSKQESRDKKTGLHIKAKWAYPLLAGLAVVIVAAIMLSSFAGSGEALTEPQNTQNYQANKPLASSGQPAAADKEAGFSGFVLTAYAPGGEPGYLGANFLEEADKLPLTPDVKVLLARYSPAMSSVPGLPFTVDITTGGVDDLNIDAINASADCGGFSRWDRVTGTVTSAGQSITIGRGETIYWSPMYNDGANANKITITIEAVAGNAVVGRQSIYITQGEPGFYYATAGELELL